MSMSSKVMAPVSQHLPLHKNQTKSRTDRKVSSPVMSKLKPLPSIKPSDTNKQKSRPKLSRSKSQEIISKSKLLSLKEGEPLKALSPLRLSQGQSLSTSKIGGSPLQQTFPAEPRRFSFGVSKSLPPSGGNGSRRASEDFNNNARSSRANHQNHSTVVLPHLFVKPSLENKSSSNRLNNNSNNGVYNKNNNNSTSVHQSIKKSKSNPSFNLSDQNIKKSSVILGNISHKNSLQVTGSDFGHPVTRTKMSKSTEYLPRVEESKVKIINNSSFNAKKSSSVNKKDVESRKGTKEQPFFSPRQPIVSSFTSPWADDDPFSSSLSSTFNKLTIPKYKRDSTVLPPTATSSQHRQKEDGKSTPRWCRSGPHPTHSLDPPNSQNSSHVSLGKPSGNVLLGRPAQILSDVISSPIRSHNTISDLNKSPITLEHKRSFHRKKSKPKLMRNRTFDVIETKMQNLPVIDLENED